MDLLKLFDAYSRRARIYPALLALVPLLALAALLVPWSELSLSQAVASLVLGVVFFALSAVSRRAGKRMEAGLYMKWGGKPSVIILRHSDQTLDARSKARYHGFLAKQIGGQVPTAVDEARDPNSADVFYESAGNWLRENVRNKKDCGLIREENIHYGFWRNLFGLKWMALAIAAMVALVSAAMLLWNYVEQPAGAHSQIWIAALAVAIVHGLFIATFVTETAVREAAFQYGRQLILACEILVSDSFRNQESR